MMDIESSLQDLPRIDSKHKKNNLFVCRSTDSPSTVPPSETTLSNSASDDLSDDREDRERSDSSRGTNGILACKRSDFSGNYKYADTFMQTSVTDDYSQKDLSISDEKCFKKPLPGTRKVVCEEADCYKTPSYGFESDRRRRNCSQHKQQGMVYLKRRKCSMENCEKLSSYGRLGGSARFCLAHRSPDMVDLVNRRCEKEGCNRRPVFALPGQKARMCSNHRNLNMTDVVNQRCTSEKCSLLACYGLPGERARYCASHRTEGMQRKKVRGSSTTLHFSYGRAESSELMRPDLLHPDLLPSRENDPTYARRLNDTAFFALNQEQMMPQAARNIMSLEFPASVVPGCITSQPQFVTPKIIASADQQKPNLSYLQADTGLAYYQPTIPLQPNIIPNIGVSQADCRISGYNPAAFHSYLPSNILPERLANPSHQIRAAAQPRLIELPRATELEYQHSQLPATFGYALPASQMIGYPTQSVNVYSENQGIPIRKQAPIYPTNLFHSRSAENMHYGTISAIPASFAKSEEEHILQRNYDMQVRRAEVQQYQKILAASNKEELMRNSSLLATNPSNIFPIFNPDGLRHEVSQPKSCRSTFDMNYCRPSEKLTNPGTLPSCSKLLGQVYNSSSDDIHGDIMNIVRGGRANGEMSNFIETMNMQSAVPNF